MIPKPLKVAEPIVRQLAERGITIRVEEDSLILHDSNKILTDEIRETVRDHKMAILAFLQHQAIVQLLRVLDMSDVKFPTGMMEEAGMALAGAKMLVGDIWETCEDIKL